MISSDSTIDFVPVLARFVVVQMPGPGPQFHTFIALGINIDHIERAIGQLPFTLRMQQLASAVSVNTIEYTAVGHQQYCFVGADRANLLKRGYHPLVELGQTLPSGQGRVGDSVF